MKLRNFLIEWSFLNQDSSHQDARNFLESLREATPTMVCFECENGTVYAINAQKSVWQVATAVCSVDDQYNREVGETIARWNLLEGRYINLPRDQGQSVEEFAREYLALSV